MQFSLLLAQTVAFFYETSTLIQVLKRKECMKLRIKADGLLFLVKIKADESTTRKNIFSLLFFNIYTFSFTLTFKSLK